MQPPPQPKLGPPESTPAEQAAVNWFDDSKVHEVRLYMSDDDFTSIIQDSRGDELRAATISIDGVVMAGIGLRPAGESSRVPGNQKMSMHIKFGGIEKGKRMGGLDEVKLSGSWDDAFISRDRLGYWAYRQVIPAPREVAAQLWINDQPRGVYEIEEIWDKEALASRFADASGPLYRIRGVPSSDPYAYRGTDEAAYVPSPWAPKGAPDAAKDAVIADTLRVLADTPDRIGDVMDVDTLLSYLAISAIVANTDAVTSAFKVGDHFEYDDPVTGRLFILPWDPDNTFGSINDPPDSDMFQNYDNSIITRVVRDGALREPFLSKLEDIMQRVPATAIEDQANAIFNQIEAAAADDKTKMYPTDTFVWSLSYVNDWIDARYASLAKQIANQRAKAL
jgi:spore coat protein CotH